MCSSDLHPSPVPITALGNTAGEIVQRDGWVTVVRENQVLKVDMDRMSSRVGELEEEFGKIKQEMKSATKSHSSRSSPRLVARKIGCKLVPQPSDAQPESLNHTGSTPRASIERAQRSHMSRHSKSFTWVSRNQSSSFFYSCIHIAVLCGFKFFVRWKGKENVSQSIMPFYFTSLHIGTFSISFPRVKFVVHLCRQFHKLSCLLGNSSCIYHPYRFILNLEILTVKDVVLDPFVKNIIAIEERIIQVPPSADAKLMHKGWRAHKRM